jgi:ppGpp synthetase/RelA/SpoT-type nucleotidyltranferase
MASQTQVDETKLLEEFKSLSPTLNSFGEELSHQLTRLLLDAGIALGFPIQHRVKSWESLSEKVQRRSLSPKSVKELQDLVGLRIILLFGRDVRKVCDIISTNFTIVDKEDTAKRLKADQFGYVSTHFVAELSPNWLSIPTFSGATGLRAELQVRTLAQHIWAEASYHLQYKQEPSIPAEVRRSVHRVSALLEVVDLEFERVLDLRESYRSTVDVSTTNEDLNVDLLEKMLDLLLPASNKKGDEDFGILLNELLHFGIRKQGDLRALVANHLDKALTKDKNSVLDALDAIKHGLQPRSTTVERTNAGVYYTFMGLVRQLLSAQFGDFQVTQYVGRRH